MTSFTRTTLKSSSLLVEISEATCNALIETGHPIPRSDFDLLRRGGLIRSTSNQVFQVEAVVKPVSVAANFLSRLDGDIEVFVVPVTERYSTDPKWR